MNPDAGATVLVLFVSMMAVGLLASGQEGIKEGSRWAWVVGGIGALLLLFCAQSFVEFGGPRTWLKGWYFDVSYYVLGFGGILYLLHRMAKLEKKK